MLKESLATKRQLLIRVGNLYDLLIERLRTNQGGISGKSFLGLVKLVREFAKSVTETNNKVHKPKIYN